MQGSRSAGAADVMTPFLSRVYDCKYRFEKESGFVPTQLFFGPAEMLEIHNYVKELERGGLLVRATQEYRDTLADMTIIGLASDGMRAGISSV